MKKKVILGIVLICLIALIPLFALPDAEFGGSDDAGSQVVEEVDSSYEPWACRARWKASFSAFRPVLAWESLPLSWEDL